MSFFGYFNGFWDDSNREPFSITEVALYHYLLNVANRQRFRMPIRCSTSVISVHLKTSKQNVVKAREGLKSRGIISFASGTGRDAPASYQLSDLCLANNDTQSDNRLQSLSVPLSDSLSDINNKVKIEYETHKWKPSTRDELRAAAITSRQKDTTERINQLDKKYLLSHDKFGTD